jgi:hypothetical protein
MKVLMAIETMEYPMATSHYHMTGRKGMEPSIMVLNTKGLSWWAGIDHSKFWDIMDPLVSSVQHISPVFQESHTCWYV